jgi:hypothetical protein
MRARAGGRKLARRWYLTPRELSSPGELRTDRQDFAARPEPFGLASAEPGVGEQ